MKICEHIVYVHVIVIANFCNKRMAASKDMRYWFSSVTETRAVHYGKLELRFEIIKMRKLNWCKRAVTTVWRRLPRY